MVRPHADNVGLAARKMNSLLLLAVCGLAAWSANAVIVLEDAEVEKSWIAFKKEFNKVYGVQEEPHRRTVFEENLQYVLKHNMAYMRGESSYELQTIEHDDLTEMERQELRRGKCHVTVSRSDEASRNFTEGLKALKAPGPPPATRDWRTEGVVSSIIRNQPAMSCGGCYAIAAVESLQSMETLKTQINVPKTQRKVPQLSIQQPIDCCKDFHAACKGCDGGNPTLVYYEIQQEGGIQTDAAYPVATKQDQSRKCLFKNKDIGAKVKSWNLISDALNLVPNEAALTKAVGDIGPVVASVCVGKSKDYAHYKSGILDEKDCLKNCKDPNNNGIDHSITVVGYTKDAWILKDSQGSSFGQNGYVEMKRGVGMCGIGIEIAYPIPG